MDEINDGKEQEQLRYSNSNMYMEELYEDLSVKSRNVDQKDFTVNADGEKHCEFPNTIVHDNILQKYTSYDRQDDITAVTVPSNDTQESKLYKNKCDDNSDDENSPTRFYNDPEDSVTVRINTEYGVLLELYLVPKKFNIMDLKIILVKDTGISYEDLVLQYNGEDVNSDTSLMTIAEENKLISFSVVLGNAEDSLNIKLGCREIVLPSGIVIKIIGKKFAVTKDTYSLENILLVNKNERKTDVENIHIKWLPYDHHKPFLGGYRNIVTNCRYHNASSQTKPIPRKTPQVVKTSRDTQTYRMRHFGNITVNHMSTQFSKPGFFVSNSENRVKTPGPYETADEYLARVLTKIIIIQKYVRRWLAKRRVARLKKIRDNYIAWEEAQAQEYKDEISRRIAHDFERRLHPKTRADFDRLYNALEAWRKEEVNKIKEQNLTEAEKKAALALLLDEEAELISAINKHQVSSNKKTAQNIQSLCLKKASAPHRWISAINGRIMEVATVETIRAKELLDIYESLSMENLTHNERLDILLTLKQTVTPYNIKISKEIIGLVDREAELIIRGVPDKSLSGLRQRIRNRFIQFAKLPQVNPEIGKYLTVPTNTKETTEPLLVDNIQYCISCKRYLKKNSFPLSSRANKLYPCESCRRNDNRGRERLDLEPYQYILTELRQNETRLVVKMKRVEIENAREAELQRLEQGGSPLPETDSIIDGTHEETVCINPLPFLMNKEDIRFLIDQIWESRSVLSGWTELFDLTLTRWNINEPWAPWNTVVVTREEAEIHAKLSKLKVEEIYAEPLINLVNQRLIMGKNEFLKLYQNGHRMTNELLINTKPKYNPENKSEKY
ncbi:IQ and ubiquitin-like domain-containing protein [Schistosoma japonicum]|nr:IQ and ubiquitin-like domain-containing protein [Schistosoma japonicum]KAH8870792.1 IQ and ubiquitin-like domain-containing protein [Schistosoma japonicum]